MKRPLAHLGVAALLLAGCESAQTTKTQEPAPAPAPAAEVRPAPAPAAPAPPTPAPAAPAAPTGPPAGQEPVGQAPTTPRTLFIKSAQANFRAAPGTNARIQAVLRKGTRVEVLEGRNQWYRVKLADGREGCDRRVGDRPRPE